MWLKKDISIKKISRNYLTSTYPRLSESKSGILYCHTKSSSKSILAILVLSQQFYPFFTIFFFNIWKDKSKEEKSRSDFIQHLFFPMLRCKTWVCNVDISYLKITVLIEESHFFKSVPKKSATGQKAMAWNHNKWSEYNTSLNGRADTEHP